MGLVRIAAATWALPVAWTLWFAQRRAVGRDAVLELTLEPNGDIRERDQFVRRLRRVGEDPTIAALVLRFGESPGGWAAAQDLRDAIRSLRAAGKRVYAVLEAPGNAVAWVASAADRVFMVPTGEYGLVGVGVELTFFGAALGRLGIKPDFEAAGAYKSFGETFTRSYASPENHEAVRDLVDDLHAQLVAGIAEGRGKSEDDVRALLARAPLSAEEAREAGLVDATAYEDELLDWLKEQHGAKTKLVPFSRWALIDAARERFARLGRTGTVITVLHLQGPIALEDRSGGPSIGARKVVPLLTRLREDERVGAVVLHVDSPGGSALASDLIWREVELLRKRKVVVASFENVSASGGFYLSAPAQAIFVRAATLTGSIGVFGGKLVMGEGLRRVGVHTQEVLGAPNANLFSASRPFHPDQRVRFRASLQRFYDGFVGRVAAGRGKEVAELEPHCRGRVWTGRAALERSLVDAQGDLSDAIARARDLAGLAERPFVRRDWIGHERPLVGRLMSGLVRQLSPFSSRASVWVERWLAMPGVALAEIALDHPNEPLAMLPFDIRVR
ncbi:MAG: S49 family peptidase [Myxococcota bacterium]